MLEFQFLSQLNGVSVAVFCEFIQEFKQSGLVVLACFLAHDEDPVEPADDNPATQVPPPAPNQGCHVDCIPCVPIESDVGCEGGSCDGPAYVRGPVTVIGPDAYRLDGDNNGIACE